MNMLRQLLSTLRSFAASGKLAGFPSSSRGRTNAEECVTLLNAFLNEMLPSATAAHAAVASVGDADDDGALALAGVGTTVKDSEVYSCFSLFSSIRFADRR